MSNNEPDNGNAANKTNNLNWGSDRPQSRHTSTLNIPIKTPTGVELGEGRRRQQHDILSHEIDRMNARMRDLRKSFEDLTTTTSASSTSSRVKNNFFERSSIQQQQQQQQQNLNSTMPSLASHRDQPNATTTTLPRKGLNTGSTFGGSNISSKDDFEREVENFRRNFQEFRHSSSSASNNPNTTMTSRGSGLGIDPSLQPLNLPPPPSTALDWDGAQTYVEGSDGVRKLYRVTLDMNDFSPADIKVKVVDGNVLRVSAKTDRSTSRGGNVQREFNREFTIPPDVDVDALVSRIDGRGVMTLEAPVRLNPPGQSILDSPPKFRSSTSSTYNATSTSKLGSNTATLQDDDRFDSRPPRRKYSWTGSLRNFPTSPPTTLGSLGRDRFHDLEGSNSLFASSTLPHPRPPLVPPPPSHLNSTTLSDGPFKMSFDMRDYAPEEIKISVTDNMLKVRAKHEERSPSGTVSREFNREYTIPRHVNPDTIKSVLGRDGTLTIESNSNSITNTTRAPALHNTSGGSVNSTSLANDYLEDQTPFKLRFDMAAYQPDEIKVKVTGGMVRVEARHQEIHPERGNILREFSREYVIPKGIDPDQLRSSLSPSGILTIEAATAIAPF